MKKLDFLICIVCLIIGLLVGFNTHTKTDRYQIVKGDNNTILLDKQTGLTWRNVWIDDKDKIPAYWEEMGVIGDENTRLPIGKQDGKKPKELEKKEP